MRALLLTFVLSLGFLSGCASLNTFSSQVSSHGTWPADRQPGAYVFERLPSQTATPELTQQQAALEDAARPALQAAGFSEAAEPALAAVVVQLASQVQVEARPPMDNFWYPYGAWGWGGFWGPGRGGVALGLRLEPPYVQMEVSVLMRDRASHTVLYETRARHDRLGAVDERLYPLLFEAALKDFPLVAVSPRTVTLTPQK
ncbi:DUF4136 domain-containing protein [Aquabacterium sp. A3]|uniref:DUF4136 domain-containing protein n=1 Tax=Aquabacterium sp. A3 TaxID=3132829 RepID=UPI003119FA8C